MTRHIAAGAAGIALIVKEEVDLKKISLMQEAEQELIKESIFIDYENSRAIVHLPFKANPKEFLRDNSYSAQARLLNTCKKYYKDEIVRKQIIASFDKLRNRGHLKYYEDLSENQRNKLENSEVSYTIPWDISFKASSVSTPTRSVYDASAKTSTGFSLNDLLATGVPDLVRLFELVLEWQIGPVAIVGDVSQFYPTIKLHEDSWPFQKIMLREDLNPNGKLILAVIVAVIFGMYGQQRRILLNISRENGVTAHHFEYYQISSLPLSCLSLPLAISSLPLYCLSSPIAILPETS